MLMLLLLTLIIGFCMISRGRCVGRVRNGRLAGAGKIGIVVCVGRLRSFLESSPIDQVDDVSIDEIDHVLGDLSLLSPTPPIPQPHREDCNYAKRDGDSNTDLGARVQAGGFWRWVILLVGCRGTRGRRRRGLGGAAPGGFLSCSRQGSPLLGRGTLTCDLTYSQVEPARDVGGDVQVDERGSVVGLGVLHLH